MTYYVTPEWAMQLAFEKWGDLDFAKMNVVLVQADVRNFRIVIFPETPWDVPPQDLKKTLTIEEEVVNLLLWADSLNNESTWLGYEERTNTLVVGVSRYLKYPPERRSCIRA